jgi:hypothetical protein
MWLVTAGLLCVARLQGACRVVCDCLRGVVLLLSGESDDGARASCEPVCGRTAEWREVPFRLSMRVLHAMGMSTLRSV